MGFGRDEKRKGNRKRPLERRADAGEVDRRIESELDDALEGTFPASDPVSCTQPSARSTGSNEGH
jgi:hypothetical protein